MSELSEDGHDLSTMSMEEWGSQNYFFLIYNL